ncbi:exported protein family 4 Plasmodium exported, putative [Plasmodium sp. gorilla clade G2]|uniref:exported protein family 4 Plasmodium exported, putative n=1 Tax=Plasmodium sp. gorilla clade G2 TaxID=880535 RepID=UPI000D20E480|nr:exported protein family 4 Plasmodium exported, putative [Plasmodium sp. gorilla clade G2]SOV10288.1 exported protein family 4 Plasmodium exported, putative [Plasmodium sp. gorilla clade G2]
MTFFYVRILNVAIDNATQWKKEKKCCKNNLNFLSFKRCLLQHVVEENIERKGTSRVLLKEKKNEQGKRKKIKKTKSIKPKNEKKNNKNNIVLKNLSDKKDDNISNNKQMEENNIICKDINSNEINDNQKVQEIKEKLVKGLLENKNKEIIKQIEIINSDGTMTKIKNSLYSLIFKGANFWKGLSIYLGTLSGAAIGQMILILIFKLSTIPVWSALIPYSFVPSLIAFSSFIGLIILTIIGVLFLLMWLWPSRGKLMGHNNRENKSDT